MHKKQLSMIPEEKERETFRNVTTNKHWIPQKTQLKKKLKNTFKKQLKAIYSTKEDVLIGKYVYTAEEYHQLVQKHSGEGVFISKLGQTHTSFHISPGNKEGPYRPTDIRMVIWSREHIQKKIKKGTFTNNLNTYRNKWTQDKPIYIIAAQSKEQFTFYADTKPIDLKKVASGQQQPSASGKLDVENGLILVDVIRREKGARYGQWIA